MVRFRSTPPDFAALLLLTALNLGGCTGDDTATDGSASESSGSSSSTTAATSASSTETTQTTQTPETQASATLETSSDSDSNSDSDGTTGGDPLLVQVGHTRELRGAWIASVFNINFPSQPGLDAASQEEELIEIFDRLEAAGLNAAFFQVRPESDALYASDLEPWSRSLTGTQGEDPGWDPLAVAIDLAHARNIELHAWLNPYRAKASLQTEIVPPHIALAYPEHAHKYGAYLWMDPGALEVQTHLLAVIEDLISRYDIDGVHFDDYFYPYPTDDPFPDELTWGAYVDSGGTLSRDDWRRQNVDSMVESVGLLIEDLRPSVRFGISPFGIYRPGIPEGISGFDQYEGLYADPLKWLDQGWLDYLAPQLYWPTTYPKQAYDVLVAWWAQATSGGRHIFAGNYLSKLGSSPSWSLDEMLLQIQLTREQSEVGARGNIYFNVEPILDDWEGFASMLGNDLYISPALTPAIAAASGISVTAPEIDQNGDTITLMPGGSEDLRAYSVYYDADDQWLLDRLVPIAQDSVQLSSGTWAIAAVSRSNIESLGSVVVVP
ncbi:MAG TPA: hypothetical protein ENJ18_18965 [Nannocystis exedens]|nr:hypothetical protein [Nannocystis exedens]